MDTFSAFTPDTLIASGSLTEVALSAKLHLALEPNAPMLIFDNRDAQLVEIDFRGGACLNLIRYISRNQKNAHEREGLDSVSSVERLRCIPGIGSGCQRNRAAPRKLSGTWLTLPC